MTIKSCDRNAPASPNKETKDIDSGKGYSADFLLEAVDDGLVHERIVTAKRFAQGYRQSEGLVLSSSESI
jgi:hypothetical protein